MKDYHKLLVFSSYSRLVSSILVYGNFIFNNLCISWFLKIMEHSFWGFRSRQVILRRAKVTHLAAKIWENWNFRKPASDNHPSTDFWPHRDVLLQSHVQGYRGHLSREIFDTLSILKNLFNVLFQSVESIVLYTRQIFRILA